MSAPHRNFSNYQAVDFVLDETFVAWVKNPTPALDAFWQQWLLDHPFQKPVVEEAIQMIAHLTTTPHSIDTVAIENMWEHLSAAHDAQTSIKELPGKTFFLWPYRKGIAAAAVLLVGLVVWWQWSLRRETVRTIVYTTQYGDTRHIWLPDSSEVFLNANSRLTFPDNWDASLAREVWIEGEAYCKIRKQPDRNGQPRRFIAHTQNVKVEVLGTEFNVIHRRGNSVVILNSGKVQLTSNETATPRKVFMKPGELVSYSDTQKVFLTKLVNPHLYSAWVNHKLVFNQTTLREIAQMLSDNYGMTVVFKQPRLSAKKFTATIPSNNLNVLFTALQESFNVQIERQDSQITISEKR
jgi:transmembrane sensor